MLYKKILQWLFLSSILSSALLAAEKVNEEDQSADIDFIRFNETEFKAALETASAKYINDDGVEVELIGAVHIADK